MVWFTFWIIVLIHLHAVKFIEGKKVLLRKMSLVYRMFVKFMGSVDAAAAHRSQYEIDIRSVRHNNRNFIAFWEYYCLINPAIVMAQIYGDVKVHHETYRRALLRSWAEQMKTYKRENGLLARKPRRIAMHQRQNSTKAIVRDGHGCHYQVSYVPPNPDQKDKRVTCNICGKKTAYVCSLCVPQVGLCRNWAKTNPPNRTCWQDYHQKYFPRHSSFPK